jgi:hypothetical protein
MTTSYGAGALRRAEQAIQSAPNNDRNNTFYAQARGCFELAAGGELGLEQAWERLVEAGRAAGLDGAEIKATLRSARRDGSKKPRQSPDNTNGSGAEVAMLPPIPAAPPTYPPLGVVEALWDATDSVLAHEEACAYLERRGLDPQRVSRLGRCRYLPKGAPLPSELRVELREALPKIECGGVWKHAPLHGFRLLFPLLDSLGNVRSLQLRWMDGDSDKPRAKSVALKPQKRGLVLANRAGLAMLRRDPGRKTFWGDRPLEVVIVEGETDFLCAACEDAGEDKIRAVFGISSGAWTDAHAIAIPEGATVIIATDNDAAGDKYADKIRGTLERGRSKRWTPNQGKDVCDAGGLAGGTLT